MDTTKEKQTKKVALMSKMMDNRKAKGTALYTRKLISGLLEESNDNFSYTLVHYEEVDDELYDRAEEIIMPYPDLDLPIATRF
ncbi:MAG: hypothetical protein ABEJ24_02620, partial [Candidatus Magasanikbacteria bacterium]